jgi:hypothetical protein
VTVQLTTHKLESGAGPLARAVHAYIVLFGQLALHAVSSMQDPLATFFLSSFIETIAFLLCFRLSV